jgi:hypothetical protein
MRHEIDASLARFIDEAKRFPQSSAMARRRTALLI